MTDADQVRQALAEMWDVVKCRCHEAYTGRGLHDPDCQCDSTDAVQTVANRIEALTAKLAKAVEALENLADCVDLGCFCSEMQMATAMDIARATLAEIKGESHD